MMTFLIFFLLCLGLNPGPCTCSTATLPQSQAPSPTNLKDWSGWNNQSCIKLWKFEPKCFVWMVTLCLNFQPLKILREHPQQTASSSTFTHLAILQCSALGRVLHHEEGWRRLHKGKPFPWDSPSSESNVFNVAADQLWGEGSDLQQSPKEESFNWTMTEGATQVLHLILLTFFQLGSRVYHGKIYAGF